MVVEALKKLGREDLIGFGPECLVRPVGSQTFKGKKPAQKKPAAPSKSKKQGKMQAKKPYGKKQKKK